MNACACACACACVDICGGRGRGWVGREGRNLYPRLIIDVSTDFHKMLLKNQK